MSQSSVIERLQMAYNYLYDNGKVHTITDLANKMKRSRASVSKALNGSPDYLTDKFLTVFARSFDNIISLEWLLTGKGEMVAGGNIENEDNCLLWKTDQSSLINSAIAGRDEANASKKETIESLKRELETKDKMISMLERENNELREKLSKECSLKDFPFDMGVAESPIDNSKRA